MTPPVDANYLRLAEAMDRLATGLENQTVELRKVDAKRSKQLDRQTRTLRMTVGLMLGKLVTLVVILSAVYPGVPILRINEHNQKHTAEVVRELNCGVMWANGTRLSSCADVFRALDAQAAADGVPIPGR